MSTPLPAPSLSDPSGQHHFLEGATIRIGRAVENDIVIASKRVSRDHAVVRREGRQVLVEDLNSANGTYLNDERVLAPAELQQERAYYNAGVESAGSQFSAMRSTTSWNALPAAKSGVMSLKITPGEW